MSRMRIPSLYPPAVWRPVSYIGEAGPLRECRGWILHVVVGNGSPFGTFQGARSPNRRFSHLWVSKEGRWEQYQRLDRSSWAQAGGNGSWWSVETEGFDTEPLTEAQLDALAAWHVWCGAADVAADSPEGRGIGTHRMGGSAWGGHECPGKIRSGQRVEIIRRAVALRSGVSPGKEVDVELTDRVDVPKDGQQITVGQAIRGGYMQGLSNAKVAAQLAEATGGLVKAIAALTVKVTEVAARLDRIEKRIGK